MTITISAEQRDQLYERILLRLSGIDTIYLCARAGNFAAADQLAREFAALLLFLTEDLGWGEGTRGQISLKSPPARLARVAEAILNRLEAEDRDEQEESEQLLRAREHNQSIRDTCRQLLLSTCEQSGFPLHDPP